MKYIAVLVVALVIDMEGISQKIKVTLGPVLDQKEIVKMMGVPKFKIGRRATTISTGIFFDNVSNKSIIYFGFSGSSLRFMVSDDYIKPGYGKDLSAELVKEGDKESIQLVSFVSINNRLYIFYAIDFPKTDQFSVYMNEVSKDFVVMGSPILVHNYKDLKKYGHSVNLLPSRNNQYFLLSRDIETKPREPQKFECTVIDSLFSPTWSRLFEMENKDKELLLQSIDLDNNGNLYVLAEKEVKPEAGPVLYFYGWKDKLLKSAPLGLADGDNFGVKLEIVNGTTPYLVGLNQQKKSVRCFVDRFDVTSASLQHLGNTPMPDDFYKASNFNAFETNHWSVSNLVSLENKDLVASVEARLVKYVNGVPMGYYTYFTFLNVFTEQGALKYQHTIRKIQGSANEFIGLSLFAYKTKVLAIYNDHPKNLKLSPTEKKVEGYTGIKEAMIMVQEIDENGIVSKYPLTTDPQLENWNLNLSSITKIKGSYYYANAMSRKGMLSFESRALTFEIE
jgi:hypothetical protein